MFLLALIPTAVRTILSKDSLTWRRCRRGQRRRGAESCVARYLEKYRDMPTYGQYRVAGIAMRMANEKGVSLLGPALFQQLYLPTKPKG
jgi:hypothetical protein